jgi:hypothetical protein
MSHGFVELTDFIVGSSVVRGNSELTRHLLNTTAKFINLAKNVADEEDAKNVSKSPSTEEAQMSVVLRTFHESGSTGGQASLLPTRKFSGTPQAQSFNNPFGNGWFGRVPEIAGARNPPSSFDTSSLAIKLLLQTVTSSYYALLTPNPHSSHIFRFALLFHTREEILSNLRWFLGPGIKSLKSLAPPVFGITESITWESVEAPPKLYGPKQILDPMVDIEALMSEEGVFLNADGVEGYLRASGVVWRNGDIARMEVNRPKQAHPRINSLEDTSSDVSPVKRQKLMPTPVVQNLFNFTALLPGNDQRRSGMDFASDYSYSRYVTLSSDTFIQHLGQFGVCLGNGPGYTPSAIERAIESSVIWEA